MTTNQPAHEPPIGYVVGRTFRIADDPGRVSLTPDDRIIQGGDLFAVERDALHLTATAAFAAASELPALERSDTCPERRIYAIREVTPDDYAKPSIPSLKYMNSTDAEIVAIHAICDALQELAKRQRMNVFAYVISRWAPTLLVEFADQFARSESIVETWSQQ